MGKEDDAPDKEPQQVAGIACNLPPFWSGRPEVYFATAEAKFALAGVTSESTKFNHVLSILSQDVATEVFDIISAPDKEKPYTTLKQALIARMSLSETQKVKQLLSGLELGDRKPSQLYRHMQTLVGDGKSQTVNEQVLRELFLQRMPTHVQPVLISLTTLSLADLANVADKVVEATPAASVAAVTATSPMEEQMKQLVEQMNKLLQHVQPESNRARSKSRGRGTHQRATSSDPQPICWYHRRFKEKANRCTQPCSYSKNELGSQK